MSELKGVGIDEKGYGKVYKIVMRNNEVSLTAKALYAYFCSYAGSGTTAFPRREKITSDLNINKNTFTKYLGCLIDAGYISRTRTPFGNVYEILTTVPNGDGVMTEAKSLGYGTVPKLAMLDSRLSANAKGLYAYLCSYAGSGSAAYPRQKTILWELGIGKDAYYRSYKALIALGYISPSQGVDKNGQYTVSTYVLNETLCFGPENEPDKVKNSAAKRDSQEAAGDEDAAPPEQWEEDIEPRDSLQSAGHGTCVVSEVDFSNPVPPTSQKSAQDEGAAPRLRWGEIGNTALQCDCEEDTHGTCEVFNNVFNSGPGEALPGDAAVSWKPESRKTDTRFLGQPNINNKYHKEHFFFEEVDNQHPRARAHEDDVENPCPLLTKSRVKKLMHYDYLLREAEAWACLKDLLGHYDSPDGQSRYMAHCKAIIDELAHQLTRIFGRTAGYGRHAEREKLKRSLKAAMPDAPEMFDLVCSIADSETEIRNLSGYLRQTVINLAAQAD